MSEEEEEATRDVQEAVRPKKKPRASRALQHKVVALEDQMQKVQSSLDNVVFLLQRSMNGAPVVPSLPATTASSKHSSGPSTVLPSALPSSISGSHQRTSSSSIQPLTIDPQPVSSLAQWVNRVSSTETTATQVPSEHPHISPGNRSSFLGSHLDVTDNYQGTSVERLNQTSLEDDLSADEGKVGYDLIRGILRGDEKARLEADGLGGGTTGYRAGTFDDGSGAANRGTKRPHSANGFTQRGSMSTTVLDPIDLGMCSEIVGKELFQLFFQGCHAFIPVFDPELDNWLSLRTRSPFSISAILYVGQKIRDAGQPPSDLQLRLREHVEGFGRNTLFSPVATIEALQAMLILAAWGETTWRPGFLALSMAYDMDLHKCLPRLANLSATRHTGQFSQEEAHAHRNLVVGARLWLMVAKQSIEMSINNGRPLFVDEIDILPHLHAILNQPYTLTTDSRIVATCENLTSLLPLHRSFVTGKEDRLDDILQTYIETSQAWLSRWQAYYEQRGVPSDNVLFTDLETQRSFGTVLANSFLLRYVHSRADVENLPIHRRHWLLTSLDMARQITQRILLSEKDKLLYANHYSHVALASVLRIYVRLASLFPDAVDLHRTARDLTQITNLLAQFPGVSFAHQLRRVIQQARQTRVLPAETRPGSPRPAPYVNLAYSDVVPYRLEESPVDFDLFTAERLISQPQGINDQVNNGLDFLFGDDMIAQPFQNNTSADGTVMPWFDFPSFVLNIPDFS